MEKPQNLNLVPSVFAFTLRTAFISGTLPSVRPGLLVHFCSIIVSSRVIGIIITVVLEPTRVVFVSLLMCASVSTAVATGPGALHRGTVSDFSYYLSLIVESGRRSRPKRPFTTDRLRLSFGQAAEWFLCCRELFNGWFFSFVGPKGPSVFK